MILACIASFQQLSGFGAAVYDYSHLDITWYFYHEETQRSGLRGGASKYALSIPGAVANAFSHISATL